MKKTLMILAVVAIFPLSVFANGHEDGQVTIGQKSSFASRAQITENEFAVPTVIDVPLSFDRDALEEVIVVDANGIIVSSVVINNAEYLPLILTAQNSFDGDAHMIVDGDQTTFKEFPFVEGKIVAEHMMSVTDKYDNESRTQEKETVISDENSVTLDIVSNRSFKTDSFTLYFDDHIVKPTHVRVVTVDDNGEENVLLPEKFFTQNTVVFPEGDADHYRINLKYTKPLRIQEIVFHEKNVPKKLQRFVRFIANPHMSYNIYFDTYEHVKVDRGEQPNLFVKKSVETVVPGQIKENALYKKKDSDGDGVIDSADNCVDIINAEQIDKDGNGVGDACEDFDRDGVLNAKDNCPEQVNRSQVDVDFDGIGDMCDDEESRFMEKNWWIPYIVLVIVFIVVTGLIVKTLKKE